MIFCTRLPRSKIGTVMLLGDIQDNFRRLMLQNVADFAQDDNTILSVFLDDHIAVKERLKVYHNNIVGSLTEVLRGVYPLVENLVGKDFFDHLARRFIFDHPPRAAYMHGYGSEFADFIRDDASLSTHGYLYDVARFEFALHAAYYAPDDTALAANALSEMPLEDLPHAQLYLRASAHVIESHYPLLEIQSFCQSNGARTAPDLSQLTPCHYLIFRPRLEVSIVALQDDEHKMICFLKDGGALGASLDNVLCEHPSFDFQSFLAKHIYLETFCGA